MSANFAMPLLGVGAALVHGEQQQQGRMVASFENLARQTFQRFGSGAVIGIIDGILGNQEADLPSAFFVLILSPAGGDI